MTKQDMENHRAKRVLLEHCDKKFYPYIDKVLGRLPEEVRNTEVLSDPMLRIVSFSGKFTHGCYISLECPIEHLILLNETLFGKPEFQVVYTIAHEIAHKVAGRGKTSLYEMEAEALVLKWGFERESNAVKYHHAMLESDGFEIGYEWAKQHDLTQFEQYYWQWKEGRLTSERWEELHYEADPLSILDQMGCLGEAKVISTSDERKIPDSGSLDNGILGGIMCCLDEKKAEAKRTVPSARDLELAFLEQVKRVYIEINTLHGQLQNQGLTFWDMPLSNLPALRDAFIQIGDFLESKEALP